MIQDCDSGKINSDITKLYLISLYRMTGHCCALFTVLGTYQTEMEGNIVADNDAKKSRRVRKKRLYASIMNQMEFYFSDANLTRDNYLKALMEKDKCKGFLWY